MIIPKKETRNKYNNLVIRIWCQKYKTNPYKTQNTYYKMAFNKSKRNNWENRKWKTITKGKIREEGKERWGRSTINKRKEI